MSPNQWGPATWTFLHTLAEKIKEDRFTEIGKQLFYFIQRICFNLPCPECAEHAKRFWALVDPNKIQHKEDLRQILFVFHNRVNKRKGQRMFRYEALEIYKKQNVIETYNRFIRTFHTRGNLKLLNESFHRNQLVPNLKKWMMIHYKEFE